MCHATDHRRSWHWARRLPILAALMIAAVVAGPVQAGESTGGGTTASGQAAKKLTYKGRITPQERRDAAKRAAKLGLKPGVAGSTLKGPAALEAAADPGGIPHYFGPYGNWAYSPLPKGTIASIVLESGGAGYVNPLVTIEDAYGTGAGAAAASATVVAGVITGITGGTGGANYSAPIVSIVDDPTTCGLEFGPPCGDGAAATPLLDVATLTGGMRKFVDELPQLGPAGANLLVTPNRLGAGPASADGQYLPVAVSESLPNASFPTLPASDYYVIGLVEFYERFHSDLPPTRQRGYVQLTTALNTTASPVALTYLDGSPIYYPGTATQVEAFDFPHFLGPIMVAGRDRPVRVKFYNLLPPGTAGDLFLPVDESVMGSGMGPDGMNAYSENRATVHMHGNNTVWISDGTTHQWITPAPWTGPGAHAYPKGVSARNVPDMPDPGEGALTFYYTNAQSARLLFYHDHAMGLTRLNVYAGEAAGYVITDQVETDMIAGTNVSTVNPTGLHVLPGIGIPLVIADRTWVDETTIAAQDPTWNSGTGPRDAFGNITDYVRGDLWYPHVYMSAQNPYDVSGVNAFGRWMYGPWFWPMVPVCPQPEAGCIEVGAVPNPYFQPDCDLFPPGPGCTTPWEPDQMPGTPNPSMAGEAFMDTPIVNGTAYPILKVEPKAYRFRVLNAADDRFFNLQLYVAADKTTPTTPGTIGTVLCDGLTAVPVENCTEVKMIPSAGFPNQLADLPPGVPDPFTKGPDWIQIGTEGGFLPKPVVIPSQPIGWNLNPTTFNFGVVNQHSLLLGTAERADVIVDFTGFDGQTLILYNDAPAAFPAGVPSYDYFTGVANQMESGGAPTTQPGFGPNTRTIMQIQVVLPLTDPTPEVTVPNLEAVFAKTLTKGGVFEVSQEPILIPQKEYASAYNRGNFPTSAKGQFVRVFDTEKTFPQLMADGSYGATVTLPIEPKAMHDEMGGVYDLQFGRMSGMLGLDNPNPNSTAANFLAYGYATPPTDIIKGTDFLSTPIGTLTDGTQIWHITHNGVDTHTIHTHLFNAQLVNRVAMDGIMLPPDLNELGWKDTFRINPLEIAVIAMRPVIPTPAQVPFDVPNSIRLIDPTMPAGALLEGPPPAGWFDPSGAQLPFVLNEPVNFGWEYVWHCHILAHEEMDMMHSLAFALPPNAAASNLAATGLSGPVRARLAWNDNSSNETTFTIQRDTDPAFPAPVTFTDPTSPFTDSTAQQNTVYYYRVLATNLVGSTAVYPAPAIGFPQVSANSGPSNVAVVSPPAAPSGVTGSPLTKPRRVQVFWTDNAPSTPNPPDYNVETAFSVERSLSPAGPWVTVVATVAASPGSGSVVNAIDSNKVERTTYYYRVRARNMFGSNVSAVSGPVVVP